MAQVEEGGLEQDFPQLDISEDSATANQTEAATDTLSCANSEDNEHQLHPCVEDKNGEDASCGTASAHISGQCGVEVDQSSNLGKFLIIVCGLEQIQMSRQTSYTCPIFRGN